MEFVAFVDLFIEFVEAAVHTILLQRRVYPEGSTAVPVRRLTRSNSELFTRCRIYDLAVRKSRHPLLNGYINDFLMSVRPDLRMVFRLFPSDFIKLIQLTKRFTKGALNKIYLVIFDIAHNPVEKFVFRVKDAYEHVTQHSKQS
ncbi:MAD2 mitotic arrest deficient-like 2 [Entophlyctis luteolus]|nr:MAD2 mitotic arrest deficient-like 2 [Entophlyctis luteolus]